MQQRIVRIVVGLAGAFSILLAARFVLDPLTPAATLGVMPSNPLGVATLRGDFGGLFGVCGVFALAAAIRNSASFVTVPLIAIAIVLAGRILSYAVDGGGWASVQPMLGELTLLAVFAAGRAVLD